MSNTEARLDALEARIEMLEPEPHDLIKTARVYYRPEVPEGKTLNRSTGSAAGAKNTLEDNHLDNRRLDAQLPGGNPWDSRGRLNLIIQAEAIDGIRWDELQDEIPESFEHQGVVYRLVGVRVVG